MTLPLSVWLDDLFRRWPDRVTSFDLTLEASSLTYHALRAVTVDVANTTVAGVAHYTASHTKNLPPHFASAVTAAVCCTILKDPK